MSVKQLFLLVTLGLCIGALGHYFYQSHFLRQPASTDLLPAPTLKTWGHSLVGKTNQAITVQISAVGGVPSRDDQEIVLKAEVTLNRPLENEVRFQWSLPPGSSIVSGELEDVWPHLTPGQTATTEISLLGVSKEDVSKTVTLHVSGTADGVQYAAAGSFATSSAKHLAGSEPSGFMKLQNPNLVLKKSRSAEKMEKVHQ